MYYESPALLNLTVCENALNLEGTEEDEKPKKKKEWEKGGGQKRENFTIVHCQQKDQGDLSYWDFCACACKCVCVRMHACMDMHACYLCEVLFKC